MECRMINTTIRFTNFNIEEIKVTFNEMPKLLDAISFDIDDLILNSGIPNRNTAVIERIEHKIERIIKNNFTQTQTILHVCIQPI
jgi:methionine synthase II (cobalamin-independent)